MPSSSLRMSWWARTKARTARAGVALVCSGQSIALAQEKPSCEQFAWPVSRELALFGAPELRTVSTGASLDSLERAISLELQPNARVPFLLPPGRPPKSADSFGGVITVANVPKAGIWQVTASAEAWIDVIQNGKALASIMHTGRRDCEGVRKSVRFELGPGPLTVQISGAAAQKIKVSLLPAE